MEIDTKREKKYEEEIKTSNEYIETLYNEYRDDHLKVQERELLIGENNIEKRDVKGYHGREILELLQNADDAYQKSIEEGNVPYKPLEVYISYKKDILTVTNTGTVFDKEGIKAVVQGNNSPKDGKYIGNKGTGFRSILNWAKSVKIQSGGFNVGFSKEIAANFFESIKEEEQIKKQIKKNKNLYVPMLAVPKILENASYNESTTIEISIDSKKQKDEFNVLKQLNSIDFRILLFLPNISKIIIETDEENLTYQRSVISEDEDIKNFSKIKSSGSTPRKIKIEKREGNDQGLRTQETYFVFDKVIPKRIMEDDVYKDILLSVAIPEKNDEVYVKNLYTFFPLLDTESPFNCLLHASYDLNDSRNSINSGEKNSIVIKAQLQFLIEIAKFFIQNDDFEKAYSIIMPINNSASGFLFPSVYSKFNLESFYLENLANEKIFRTVNNELISVSDNPKIFINGFPSFFKGDNFKRLLKLSSQDKEYSFFHLIENFAKKNCFYDPEKLLEKIEKLSDAWTVKQQVEVFIWWCLSGYSSALPKLLKTQKNEYLNIHEKCYFLVGDFDKIEIPEWVKIPSLRSDYQEELFSQALQIDKIIQQREINKEDHISRLISQLKIFPNIDFTYRDRSTIISAINASVETNEQARDFIIWLWDNYRYEENFNPIGTMENNNIKKIYFPDLKSGEPKDSKLFYFGTEYGNDLSIKLFTTEYSPLPSLEYFRIDSLQKEEFISFIKKFYVKEYPPIEKISVTPYKEIIEQFEENIRKYRNIGSSTIIDFELEMPSIQNLQKIIENSSEEEIILWISRDITLQNYLHNIYCELDDVKLSYKGNLQQYYRPYSFSSFDKVKNSILLVFNKTPWINIGGLNYPPNKVLQNFTDSRSSNKKFSKIYPVIGSEKIQKMAKKTGLSFDYVKQIYSIFSFCDEVTDLPSEEFYKVLLDLPGLQDFSYSEDLSRSIYRILERPETILFGDSKNKRTFMESGKVLVSYKGKLEYHSAKESFIPSTKILNRKAFPIVEKGTRTNSSNFVNQLGCVEYEKEFDIVPNSEIVNPMNSDFQNYFKSFRKYAKAFKETNSNIAKSINILNIKIIKSIKVRDKETNQINIISDDYEYLRESASSWFIVFSREVPFTSEINRVSEIIEQIFDNIANTPGFVSSKIGELFRTKEKENREFLIKKEFGSLSVIDNENNKTEIQNSFEKTLQNIKPEYHLNEDEINFDDFFSNENMIKIVSLFRKLEIDINDFQNAGFVYPIDLVSFYKDKIKDFINIEKRHFKNVLFLKAKKEPQLQETFITRINIFENFQIREIKNSVNFDPEKIIIDLFNTFCENWYFEENLNNSDADDEYASNYELLNSKNEFEDEIANDIIVQTMVYFNRADDFSSWLNKKRNDLIKEKDDNSKDPYKDKRDSIPKKGEIKFTPELKEKLNNGNSENGSNDVNDSNKQVIDNSEKENKDSKESFEDLLDNLPDDMGAYSGTEAQEKENKLKEIGNTGELVIYNYLCKEYGKENVFPRSEAFVALGILKPGQAKSSKYDLSYKTKEGKEFFVEVKSGHKNRFFISTEELEFAKENMESYKVFIVYNLRKDIPDFFELPKSFWEDSRFHKNEIIEKLEYTF